MLDCSPFFFFCIRVLIELYRMVSKLINRKRTSNSYLQRELRVKKKLILDLYNFLSEKRFISKTINSFT